MGDPVSLRNRKLLFLQVFTVDISGVEVNFHFKQKFQPLLIFFEEIVSLSQTLIL